MRCFWQIQNVRQIPACNVRIIRKKHNRYFLILQHIINIFTGIVRNKLIKMYIPIQYA